MLTKPFKPLALAFLVNLIISVEDKIKYKVHFTLIRIHLNRFIDKAYPHQNVIHMRTDCMIHNFCLLGVETS